MAIDESHEPEQLIGHGFQGGHIPMLIGTEAERWLGIGQQPMEELVGDNRMQDGNRSRFPVDAAGLHDTVIGMATDFHSLQAGHALCIYSGDHRVNSFLAIIFSC